MAVVTSVNSLSE